MDHCSKDNRIPDQCETTSVTRWNGDNQILSNLLHKDKKTIMIFLRGFYCPTCILFITLFQRLKPILEKENLKIVFVSLADDVQVREFIHRFSYWLRSISNEKSSPFPHDFILDPEKRVYNLFGIGNDLNKALFITRYLNLILKKNLGLLTTGIEGGKEDPNMSLKHAYMETGNATLSNMSEFLQPNDKFQSPGIITLNGTEILKKTIIRDSYEIIKGPAIEFVKDTMQIEIPALENFDFKYEMLKFVNTYNNRIPRSFLNKNELISQVKIGEGRQSHVFYMNWFGVEIAVKHFKRLCKDKTMQDEVKDLIKLKHTNMIQILAFGLDETNQYVLMDFIRSSSSFSSSKSGESAIGIKNKKIRQTNQGVTQILVTPFMAQRSLRDVLDSKTCISKENKTRIMSGIIQGIKYLHGLGKVHGNLKSTNVLIDKDWNVKIADPIVLKLCCCMSNDEYQSTNLKWLAPEYLDQSLLIQSPADIYAIGVILWELYTTRKPWDELRSWFIKEELLRGATLGFLETDDVSPELQQLIIKCWQNNPKARPLINEIHV